VLPLFGHGVDSLNQFGSAHAVSFGDLSDALSGRGFDALLLQRLLQGEW
jgi:hypothetical protein